jgi:predicted TIM-barrel fold metal-dependent hydrolase
MDLERFPKMDAHFHATYMDTAYWRIAQQYNLSYININTDVEGLFPPVEEQERVALAYQEEHPGRFYYICTFPMSDWLKPHWLEKVEEGILHSMQQGALGVKLWKNIGMVVRKPDNSFLMIDDDLFAPLFEFLIDREIPVLAHLGEPLNCWLPLEKMTSVRNRAYFSQHPEFHAYLHPEIPSYEKQIEARDHILQRYPKLIFVGAHLGSLEWNYKELAKRLDDYPQFMVDMSSRMGHLELQSINDYEGVRKFFFTYAERLIYGTDAYNNLTKLETSLISDWKFLSTDQLCFSTEVERQCRGLHLPEDILHQIYFENAKRVYKIANP